MSARGLDAKGRGERETGKIKLYFILNQVVLKADVLRQLLHLVLESCV